MGKYLAISLYARSPVPIKKNWRSTVAIGWVIEDADGRKSEGYFADYAYRYMKWKHGWEHSGIRINMSLAQVRKSPFRAYLRSDKEKLYWMGTKTELKGKNVINVSALRNLDLFGQSNRKFVAG
jgi:hypothetical protein